MHSNTILKIILLIIIIVNFYTKPLTTEKTIKFIENDKKAKHLAKLQGVFGCSNNLSSRAVASKVLSVQVSLTSVFGMRTGEPHRLVTAIVLKRNSFRFNLLF